MFFKDPITSSKFPSSLKLANTKAVFSKGQKVLRNYLQAFNNCF